MSTSYYFQNHPSYFILPSHIPFCAFMSPYSTLFFKIVLYYLFKKSKRAVNKPEKNRRFSRFFFYTLCSNYKKFAYTLLRPYNNNIKLSPTCTAYLCSVDMPGEVGWGNGFPRCAVRSDVIADRVGWQDAFNHWILWWKGWKSNEILT